MIVRSLLFDCVISMLARNFRLSLFALLCILMGCGSVPDQPSERAVYLDLRQIIETRERGEWLLDERELDEARPKAMLTICRVSPETVDSLDKWLDRELEAAGGPPEAQYRRGVDFDDLDEALTLDRIQALAERASADRDQCPFWLDVQPDFQGIHRPTDRFVFLAESAGVGSLQLQGDEQLLGAGGAGRLLAAVGIGHRYLVGAGGEVGGTAGLEPLRGESVSEEIETRIQLAAPVLFRIHDLTRIYDFELAATALTSPVDFDLQYGVRAQVGAGVLTVRLGDFLPYFLLTAGYEVLPWEDPAIHVLRVGTRFGVDFDPGEAGQ